MIPGRERLRFLDIDVTALPERRVAEVVGELITMGGRRIVVGHNLHSCYLYHTVSGFKEMYDAADVVLLDGAPVYALWKRQHSNGQPDSSFRVGSTDWIQHLGKVSGLQRLAVIGTSSQSNAEACRRLQIQLPHADILGIPGEGWDVGREDAVVDKLRSFEPQLVLLGLGMPLQEAVLWRRREELPEAVYGTVGGALDQISGYQRLAPRWLGRLGFEWLWRLLYSPTRVFGRVFVEPWKLAVLLIGRRLRPSQAGSDK